MAVQRDLRDDLIVVNFNEDKAAYEALTKMKQLESQGQISLRAAAVVVRAEDGTIAVKDEVSGNKLEGTATGGIVGLLIGILGGPFGILIGGATGLVIGALFDAEDEEQTESVLSQFSSAARVGHPVVLAQVSEPSAEIVDDAMSQLSGTVLRRPTAAVEAEIDAAAEAQRIAKKKARKALRKKRREKHEAEVHTRIEELKSKMHPHRQASPEEAPAVDKETARAPAA
jgi:uncharacterized membrane protein